MFMRDLKKSGRKRKGRLRLENDSVFFYPEFLNWLNVFIVSYGFKRQLQHNVRKQRWVPNRNLNYLPSGLPLSDHASLADIMLLFCRRLPRNVRSLKRPFSAIVLHIRSFVLPHPHCRCLRSWPRVLDILESLSMTFTVLQSYTAILWN